MQIAKLENLVRAKLGMIDLFNRKTNGQHRATKHLNELIGVKHACNALGIELDLSVNPYFYENGEPSTFTIKIAEQEGGVTQNGN